MQEVLIDRKCAAPRFVLKPQSTFAMEGQVTCYHILKIHIGNKSSKEHQQVKNREHLATLQLVRYHLATLLLIDSIQEAILVYFNTFLPQSFIILFIILF